MASLFSHPGSDRNPAESQVNGLIYYDSVKCCFSYLHLDNAGVEVVIRGFVAKIKASQTYVNKFDSPVQVQYRCPVDEGAAVYALEADICERRIITKCMEKKKAMKEYDDAIKEGKTALLGREHDDTSDILCVKLGNLPPGKQAVVRLEMVVQLAVQTDGAVHFILPTVLNPRYGVTNDSISPTTPKGSILNVSAHVEGVFEIERIISHTDNINAIIDDSSTSAKVQQEGFICSDHDWSFLIYFKTPHKCQALRETGDRSSVGLMKDDVLMLNLFPELPDSYFSHRQEIIFVVDRSGSMGGSKIRQAAATLLLFLKSLPSGCYFNIISFGNTFSPLFPNGSAEYNESTLNKALELHSRMYADMGGTVIMEPLQYIHSQKPITGFARQVLLLTDGEVWNVNEVLQLTARHAHECRTFAVGIGSGASTALVKGLAKAGRGQALMVLERDVLQSKVMGMMTGMLQENVLDIKLECQLSPASSLRMLPRVPPVIFAGQHLILYARLPKDTQIGYLRLCGKVGDDDVKYEIDVGSIKTIHDEALTLHRLAARAQISQWQLEGDDDCAEDMIQLSTSSNVVSSRTAMVGVDMESNILTSSYIPHHKSDADGIPVMAIRQNMFCSMPATSPLCKRAKRFMDRVYTVPVGGINFSAGRGLKRAGRGSKCAARSLLQSCSASNAVAFAAGAPQSQGTSDKAVGGFSFGARAPQSQESSAVGGVTFGAGSPQSQGSFAFGAVSCAAGPPQSQESPAVGGFSFGARAPQSQESSDEDISVHQSLFEELVAIQNFDGSWDFQSVVAAISKISQSSANLEKHLEEKDPYKNTSTWGTALALAVLKVVYPKREQEWRCLAWKGNNYIKGKGIDVKHMLDLATSVIVGLGINID